MAIRPKKQTPSNKGETGGGAPRGGASGNVRIIRGGSVAPKPKPAPKSGPTMRSTAKDKPLTAREKAAGNKRGLKAAQGKSLAPKGYQPDAAGRAMAKNYAKYGDSIGPMTLKEGARRVDARRATPEVANGYMASAPKNVISRSGRTANTASLLGRAPKSKRTPR